MPKGVRGFLLVWNKTSNCKYYIDIQDITPATKINVQQNYNRLYKK